MQSPVEQCHASHAISCGSSLVQLMLLCGLVVATFSCQEKKAVKQTAGDANKIIGTWRSPPEGWHNTEWGPAYHVMELKQSGEIKTTITFDPDSGGGGGVLSSHGTYRIADHTLTTNADVLAKGEPIQFHFKGDHLLLTLPLEAPGRPIEVYEFIRLEKRVEPSSSTAEGEIVADTPKSGGAVLVGETTIELSGVEGKLQGPQISDVELAQVKDRTDLQKLYLANSQVTDAGLVHLRKLKKLRTLALSGTKVTGKGLSNLKDLSNLDSLHLDHTSTADEGLADLGNFKALRSLNLNNTKVTDAGLAYVGQSKRLFHLSLYGTKVGDAGLSELKDLQELMTLNLSETRVTDQGLKHLKGLKSLLSLTLWDTRVTDQGVMDLKKALPKLTVLYKLPGGDKGSSK